MIQRILDRLRSYRLWLRLARQIGKGEHEAVLVTGEELLAVGPDEPLVLSLMASAAAALGDVDHAQGLRLAALESDPNRFSVLQETAHWFLDHDDPDGAYPLVKRALANVPDISRVPGGVETVVTRIVAWFKGRSAAEAIARQRLRQAEYQSRQEEWLDWAARFVAWFESED